MNQLNLFSYCFIGRLWDIGMKEEYNKFIGSVIIVDRHYPSYDHGID